MRKCSSKEKLLRGIEFQAHNGGCLDDMSTTEGEVRPIDSTTDGAMIVDVDTTESDPMLFQRGHRN